RATGARAASPLAAGFPRASRPAQAVAGGFRSQDFAVARAAGTPGAPSPPAVGGAPRSDGVDRGVAGVAGTVTVATDPADQLPVRRPAAALRTRADRARRRPDADRLDLRRRGRDRVRHPVGKPCGDDHALVRVLVLIRRVARRLASGQQPREFLGAQRSAQPEPLRKVAPTLAKDVVLAFLLDAFG